MSRSLRYEEEYYRRFWSGTEPKDLNLQEADRIRETYLVRDQPVVVLSTGSYKITTYCRVLEPTEYQGGALKNVLIFPGSLSKLNNNLFSFYDFLLAETRLKGNPSYRFFIFGHYEMLEETNYRETVPYKPPSWAALGEVLKRMVAGLQSKWGKLDLISAHSAGCIAAATLLKRSGPELLPVTLHFDRGPSSMYECSRHYWLGKLLYGIVYASGLDINVDQEIQYFVSRCNTVEFTQSKPSHCLITGVEQDCVYPGTASLVSSPRLDGSTKGNIAMSLWMFNPPHQISHPREHHGWRLGNLNNSYQTLSSGCLQMQTTENLAEAILRITR
ncbi:MAG: hypothetical protein KDK78_03415 [Chlamydiia bacterium]|nr:hypothetical protein [Chlamydiia bacterium]